MKIWAAISGSRERSQSSVSPPVGFDPGRGDFTIADVLAWARTKPGGELYVYGDSDNCALAQFGRATDRNQLVGICSPMLSYPAIWTALNVGIWGDYSFGGLVARLEALCPETTKSDWLTIDAYMAVEQVSA